ncbi:MAG: CoA transferase, partial [Halobacteriovoraceae bacterium]|nr:CoA transferase [Halobacteriovoraceae bacterium]
MIKNSLLTDVTIIDFSTRLPGPFSTYILESFGAKIIKIENSAKGGDPFTQPEYLAYAPAFKDW